MLIKGLALLAHTLYKQRPCNSCMHICLNQRFGDSFVQIRVNLSFSCTLSVLIKGPVLVARTSVLINGPVPLACLSVSIKGPLFLACTSVLIKDSVALASTPVLNKGPVLLVRTSVVIKSQVLLACLSALNKSPALLAHSSVLIKGRAFLACTSVLIKGLVFSCFVCSRRQIIVGVQMFACIACNGLHCIPWIKTVLLFLLPLQTAVVALRCRCVCAAIVVWATNADWCCALRRSKELDTSTWKVYCFLENSAGWT